MCEIAEIHIKRNKRKVKLNNRCLNEILRDELGVSLINFEGRIEFLLDYRNKFQIIDEQDAIDALQYFIKKTFRTYCADESISYEDFLEVFISEKPISKSNNHSKHILKRDTDLLEEKIVVLKKQQSIEYSNTLKYKEMLSFLRKEDFHLEKDNFGNFCKGSDIYHKEIQKDIFLVFVDTQDKKVNQKHFDFYRVKGKSAKSFIECKTSDFDFLISRFDLKEDMGLYVTEKQNY